MKKVKYFISIALVLSILLTAFTPAVAASNQEILKMADALNKLSLLQGNGGDYNLEGQLTRGEASVFIVRMIGKLNFVLQNSSKYSKTNFTDVKRTAYYAPYVGYCADQGIITGVSSSKYNPNDSISEKAFLRLVLSALGYVYGQDYNWTNVYQTSYAAKLVTDPAYQTKIADSTVFKRKQVVEILYTALSLENKTAKTKHINMLINVGAVTRDQAFNAGILRDTVPAGISLVTAVDPNKISIKMNETIKNFTAANIKITETQNTANKLDITSVTLNGDEIVVGTSGQTPEKAYTIFLSNVTDNEENTTPLIAGSFVGYKPVEIKSDFFKISKIEAVSKNTINLYYTQPINVNSELASNYEIYQNDTLFDKGSSQSMIIKQISTVNNGVTISLRDKVFAEGMDYTVKISGSLTSAYGVKLNEMSGDSMKFRAKGTDNEALKLLTIQPLNANTIELDFNKDINPTLAQQVFNYYITDSSGSPISISKAALCSDGDRRGKSVILTISGVLIKTKSYNIMINNINDISRQYSITEVSYTFTGYYPDKTDLKIINASPTDAGTLAVYLDRPLDETSAAIAPNFMIMGITHSGYVSVPAKTYYNKKNNPYLIKLFLPADKLLDGSRTYKLRIMPTLLDNMGNSSSTTIEYGFNGNGSSTAKPEMSNATIISSDSIRVSFNKEIALDAPNILNTNYTLVYSDNGSAVEQIPISVIPYDETTIILRFGGLDFSAKYTLKFKSLKDYSGINTRNAADGSNTIEVKTGK